MTLEADFKANPLDFLKEGSEGHVIIVPETTDKKFTVPEVYLFALQAETLNQVSLVPKLTATGDSIKAYYLPWKEYTAVAMDLSNDADFFFTSEMTNCRFTVWDDDPTKPKVAHVSGSLPPGIGSPSKRRDEMEKTAGLDPLTGRRLSIVGGNPVTGYDLAERKVVVKKKQVHEYRGQQKSGGGESSAFVFGVRNTKDGRWTFHAQVVQGVRTKATLITEDLTVLGHVAI